MTKIIDIKNKITNEITCAETALEKSGHNYEEILKGDNTAEFDGGFIAGLNSALRIVDSFIKVDKIRKDFKV